MKLIVSLCSLAALSLSMRAEDAMEFHRLQGAYNSAIQRAERPITQSYIQELSRLRDSYLSANRAADAQQVENEIKLMTDRIALMDKATPAPIVARPNPEKPAPPSVVPAASNGSHNVVIDTRVKVPANSPDGYPLGELRKGDVLTLQYLEGLWKAHGVVASDNPDLVREERNHQDESRMAVASASKGGRPGAVIALVPPLTAKTPFVFKVPEDRNDLVLRINKNSERKENPGQVTYQLKITR
jgi:hypothetical protein